MLYCAVGVPKDANTVVVGIYTISGIHSQWVYLLLLSLLLLLVSLLDVAVFSTVADFSTVCSGGPNDISNLHIVLWLLSSLILTVLLLASLIL
jgi:hypothetical protein